MKAFAKALDIIKDKPNVNVMPEDFKRKY